MLKKWLVGMLILATACASNARELVIAFENTLQPSASLDAKARSQMLIRNMANANVPQAMFLVQTYQLSAKDESRLALYSDAGHLIVNAGHSHDEGLVTKADLYALEVDILKANKILQNYAGYKKHIHFSYLHEAGDKAVQHGLSQFLYERHYRPVFTSFTAMRGADGYIDQRYQEKIRNNRRVDIVELENAYVEFVTASLNEQDALAFNMLGYSPIQVLVLQENDLAAYFIAAVIERVEKQGWTIIGAESAFESPIANPMLTNGFGASGYMHVISGLPNQPITYPRLPGNRKKYLDNFLQARMPVFMQ